MAFSFSARRLFIFLFLFRTFNAILVTSYIDPDEFWQCLEPAHWLAFSFGHLTWEWRTMPDGGQWWLQTGRIRSWLYPLPFGLLYKLMGILGLDADYDLLINLPKVLQALFAATTDFYTILLTAKLFDPVVAEHSLLLTLCSWFNAVYGVKTYSNSIETMLFAISMYHWPTGNTTYRFKYYCALFFSSLVKSIVAAGVAFLIRPSAITSYLVPAVHLFVTSPRRVSIALTACLLATAIALSGFILDSSIYGEYTISWLNFARVNFFNRISDFYGISSWHYYLTAALPTIAFTQLPLFLHGLTKQPYVALLLSGMILLNTLTPHKEIRFLFPASPLIIACAARSLSTMRRHRRLLIALLVLSNLVMFFIFGKGFQPGAIAILRILKRQDRLPDTLVRSVTFLMPCHSTPWQSHIHVPRLRPYFLPCDPPGYGKSTAPYDSPLARLSRLPPEHSWKWKWSQVRHLQPPRQFTDESDWFAKDPKFYLASRSIEREQYLIVYKGWYDAHKELLPQHEEAGRAWNGWIETDPRRAGDILLLKVIHK